MSETNKQDIYRVLIVDEDAALRELLAGLLRAPNRSVDVRDSARTALELTSGSSTGVSAMMRSRCPPRRSLRAGPAPRYGTCVVLIPVTALNSSAAMFMVVPGPADP